MSDQCTKESCEKSHCDCHDREIIIGKSTESTRSEEVNWNELCPNLEQILYDAAFSSRYNQEEALVEIRNLLMRIQEERT